MEEHEPVKYENIKHNYEQRMNKHPQRWSDNSMAIGGIVLAVIVTFLTILGIVVTL